MKLKLNLKKCFLFLVLLCPLMIFAQQKIDKQMVKDLKATQNFATSVDNGRHLKLAIALYSKMLNNGIAVKNYEIVVVGKGVKDLKEDAELRAVVEAKPDAVKVHNCEISMEFQDVKKEDLPKNVLITPDGVLKIFHLQALKYNTIVR